MATALAERLTPEQHDERAHGRRWLVLVVVAIAQLMVVLDATVVNIALPTAQKALGFSDDQRQWIVTAYALAFGSLLLLGGRLADLVGRKRIFLIGLGGFALASALGGMSDGFGMLVAARAIQGIFGALLAPAALSLLTTTFTDAKESAKAFGIFGAVAGSGAGMGLLLGGFLTEYTSWRWCMYVNLIFAVLAMIGGWLWVHDRPTDHRPKLDIPGILLVTAGLFSLVFGFSRAETAGWGAGITLSFIALGVVLLIAFVAWQRRSANPVLPLRILLDRNRGGSLLAMFTSAMAMFAIFLFLTYYLQGILGMSAVKSGLAFLPMVGALMISAQLGTIVLATRIAPRYIVGVGMLLAAGGMLLLSGLTPTSTYVGSVLPGLLVFGFGVGAVFSSAFSNGTRGVEAEDSGAASAALNATQQVGGSIGTALISTLVASALSSYLADHGTSPAAQVAGTVHSFSVGFQIAALILTIGAIASAAVLRGTIPTGNHDGHVVHA